MQSSGLVVYIYSWHSGSWGRKIKESKATLDYMMRPYLKKQKQKKYFKKDQLRRYSSH
jgi:hypothetical protein